MIITIKTRKYGEKTFWAKQCAGLSYVYLIRGQHGARTLGPRLAEIEGNDVWCDGTQEGLKQAARLWWANHVRDIRNTECSHTATRRTDAATHSIHGSTKT